ncbi:MlaD family protein [Mycolicibacterium hodleri]|uniref:MCE family protein n=1 Tax=Mycolicibacterium hodleri TaxID=49897 RepID=A0A502E5H1_9MYCO|nr:MlaD family protein [Mycolicibacterium hodleri]TPG32903.1 MCE family protein [Mycolicibacterium hodleri]
MTGIGRTRPARTLAGVVAAAAVVVASTSCGGTPGTQGAGYCAILPDSIGLYVGNPVTQMGYQIGTVSKLTPSASSVRVDFSVTDTRPLPNDAKAVIRSTSILADRALELVGNYESGPKLTPGQCVPLSRSVTPKSLSEVIGSANAFVNGITPRDSTNIQAALSQLDQAARGNGAGVNRILTTSSRLLDSPDKPISDIGSIISNMAVLTNTLVEQREPIKQILTDAATTGPYVRDILVGGDLLVQPIPPLITLASDLEIHAGDELQLTLDTVSDVMRVFSPHAKGLASLLGGVPFLINTGANHFNNRQFNLFYRPPLYRIRTPNGAVVCNVMNFSMPGSCANVAGQPYGVDINLLQYVFMNASQ